MKVIYNNIIPFKGFAAINLFGILFVRRDVRVSKCILNHENIHTRQMQELGYIFFYIIYLVEWIFRLFQYKFINKEAYRNISFEKEAYYYECDYGYLQRRKAYAMWKDNKVSSLKR